MTIAMYPGTFDPFTSGHLDIMQRASKTFSKLFVCIATNQKKTDSLFEPKERQEIILKSAKRLNLNNVEVVVFDGLLVDIAQKMMVSVIVRGIRAASDFDYEFQMACANAKLNENIETIFFPSSYNKNFVSSSLVKGVYNLNGDISSFVPQESLEAINDKYKKN